MTGTPVQTSLFNTHSELIGAPRAQVWEVFLDRGTWMESFVSRTHTSGTDGSVGSITEVRMNVPSSPVRTEEVLHVEPHRRLVVRISAQGSQALAHADFEFTDRGGGCRVQVSIHTWMPNATSEQLDRMRSATNEKLTTDFSKLRQRAESLDHYSK